MADIQAGIYRHYKGPLYLVFGLAHDANADTLWAGTETDPQGWAPLQERKVVVYVALQLDGAHLGPRLAVRTLEDFTALLHSTDKTICGHREVVTTFTYEGQRQDCLSMRVNLVPRFAYLGPELTQEMTS